MRERVVHYCVFVPIGGGKKGKVRRQQKQESFPPYLYYYHTAENARPFLELGRELLHVIRIMNGAYNLFSLNALARLCLVCLVYQFGVITRCTELKPTCQC